MALTITSLINLIRNSDDSDLLVGSIIQICLNLLQAVRKGMILSYRKSLQSSKCCFFLLSLLMLYTSIGVFAASVALSSTHASKKRGWSSGAITMIFVGILSSIYGFISLFFGYSIAGWFEDPRVLESNGVVLGLIYPIFAADTSRNPDSIKLLMDVMNSSSPTDLNQDIYRFSNNPEEQIQLLGSLLNQKAKMIQEINSFVDGS